MKICALIAFVLAVSGCATITDEQREERDYQEALNRAEFYAFRQRCRYNGGILVVTASPVRLGPNGIPDDGDYRCQRTMSIR
jgi:hypothetical protein